MAYLLQISDSAMESEDGPDKTTWIPFGNRISIFSSPAAGSGTSARRTGIKPETGTVAEFDFLTTGLFNLILIPGLWVKL
jgi:hypothetical protein